MRNNVMLREWTPPYQSTLRERPRAARAAPRRIHPAKSGCGCKAPPRERVRALKESHEPAQLEDVEPGIIVGPKTGARCGPFLKVEKDAERFAACNAIADEIGPIDEAEKALALIEDWLVSEVNEVFGIITLDLHLRLKSISETGRGESTATMAPMVPTLQAAVIDGAYAVIIFHVHPSGVEAEPSEADIETTEIFAENFEKLEIRFIDHIIVAGDAKSRSYYSFLEDKQL